MDAKGRKADLGVLWKKKKEVTTSDGTATNMTTPTLEHGVNNRKPSGGGILDFFLGKWCR